MLSPLANTVYRRLFMAQVLSLVGTGLATVALGLLAYQLAGERAGAVLGTALALKMVAYVGVAPVASAFTHLLPRRTLLVSLDLIRAVIALLLPIVTEVWQVYVLIFVLQACSAGFTPTFQATIPDVLPDEAEYTKALSLSRLAYDLESLLSPMLAAALLTIISFNWLFSGTVVGFLASAALVATLSLPSPKPSGQQGGIYTRTTRGLRIYLATPRLRGLLAFNLAVAAAGAMVIVNTVVLVKSGYGFGDREVAWTLAAYGLGSMLAAFTLPRLLETVSDRAAMLFGAALLGIGMLAGPLVGGWPALLAVWFQLGLGNGLVLTPSGRLLRRSSHAEDRPALFAAQFALSHACWLLTYPLVGWLGAAVGTPTTFLVMAALVGLAIILAAMTWSKVDPDELEHVHDSMEVDHPHLAQTPTVGDGVSHKHAFVIDDMHRHSPSR